MLCGPFGLLSFPGQNFSVVFISNYPKDQLLNSTFKKLWIHEQIDYAQKHNLDGVNFDFEEELEVGSDESRAYTRIFKQTVAQFHQMISNSQVLDITNDHVMTMIMMMSGEH